MTDDQVIVQIQWRPLADSSMGSVTVELGDGSGENRGQMTEAQAGKLANEVFGSSATKVATQSGGIVTWIGPGLG